MRTLLVALLMLLFIASLASANVKSANVSVTLDPGSWKSIRLKNLPAAASLKVDLKISGGQPFVLLVNEKDHKLFPQPAGPLFQSQVKDNLLFSVKIPATGNYFIILDNRAETQNTQIQASVEGATDDNTSSMDEKGNDKANETLLSFQEGLSRYLVFDSFPMKVEACGKEGGAFSGPDGVILCSEYIRKVASVMGSKEKTGDVILFTLSHEVGHTLLLQWGYPFYDNEEVADEFATMLLVLLGQKERLSSMAEFFITNPTTNELLAKALKEERHPLSIERARNIVRCMKNSDKLKRWQTILVPHLQTVVLEKLKGNRGAPFDEKVIVKELELRKWEGKKIGANVK